MRDIFIGKRLHWLALVVIIGVLWWMGSGLVQTRNFHLFLAVLAALSAGAVALLFATSHPGERVTREPFDDAG